MSERPSVEFYFDYMSGYAWFGWRKTQELCARRGVGLTTVPVLFAGLLNHWGQRGPAEIPPKRAFAYRDAFRTAALEGLEMRAPKFHPYDPLPSLRLSLVEVAGERQREVVSAIFEAGWSRGIDLGSRDELRAALDGAGLDGAKLIAKIDDPAVKAALRKNTEAAVGKGVFGVPTLIVRAHGREELFWGSDRFHHVELVLDGRDPLDHARVEAELAKARTAWRLKE